MAKKQNTLTYSQMRKLEAALVKHKRDGNPRFKTMKDLALVMEKLFGFHVTDHNISRLFRETELDRDDFVERAAHGNSILVQIDKIRDRLDQFEARLNELEEALCQEWDQSEEGS